MRQMPTFASLAEISDYIKTSESDLRRTEAVKKLYPFADADELYGEYGFTIYLLFDFVICSESPDLVIESLYFLLQIYQMPSPLLLSLTRKRYLLRKLAKALQSSVFEANILNLKSGLEIFGLLFMLISELAYFDAELLTPELVGFVQQHMQSYNARLRAFAQFSLCGILHFYPVFNRELTSTVFSFLTTTHDAQVLTALMQALASQSAREDFELCVPLDAFFEALGELISGGAAAYSEQVGLQGLFQNGLDFSSRQGAGGLYSAGATNSSTRFPALALADRILNDAMKFLVNVSTSEKNLQRMCQPATVAQLLTLYARCSSAGAGYINYQAVGAYLAASQAAGSLSRSLTRSLTDKYTGNFAGGETQTRRAILYVLGNIASTARGAEALRMTAGVEELLGWNLNNMQYAAETLEIVAAGVFSLPSGARWPCASVFGALVGLLKDTAKDCKESHADLRDDAPSVKHSGDAQCASGFLLQKVILIFNLALAYKSAVAAQIVSSSDISAYLSRCDLLGADALRRRLEQQ